MNELSLFLQLSVQLGTPFLLGTLGGILCEKVGNLNLGIEGMMILGAFSGFAARQYSDFCQELPGFFFQSPVLNGLTAAFSMICYPIQKSVPPFILFNLGQANRFPFFRPQHSSAL